MLTTKIIASLTALLLLLAIVPLTVQNSPIIAQEDNGNGNGNGEGNGNGNGEDNGNGDQNTNTEEQQPPQPTQLPVFPPTEQNATQQPPITTQEPPAETPQLGVMVEAEKSAVQRGQRQTINVLTTEPNAIYFGIITYASKSQALFLGFTDPSGADTQTFKINGNSRPGTFTVEVLAIHEGQFASDETSFLVYKRGQIPIPPVTEPPVENVTLPDGGNVTVPGGNITLPDGGNVTLPGDNQTGPSGNVTIPDGGNVTIPDNGNVTLPEGNITLPGGGNITLPDGGNVTLPDGGNVTQPGGENITIPEDGNITIPENGNITIPGGGNITIPEDGNVTLPEDGNITIPGIPGNITLPDGNLTMPGGNITIPDGAGENVTGPETGENETSIEVPAGNATLPEDMPIIEIDEPIVIVPSENITLPEVPAENMTIPTDGNQTIDGGGLQGNETTDIPPEQLPPIIENITDTIEEATNETDISPINQEQEIVNAISDAISTSADIARQNAGQPIPELEQAVQRMQDVLLRAFGHEAVQATIS
jgi:hypothetical protein